MKKASIIQKLVILGVYSLLPILFGGGDYQLRVLNLLVIFTLFTFSSNMIFGHTRQLFLCQGALVGIGAYLSVILSANLGITPWIVFLIGALVSGGIGSSLSMISSIRKLSIILVAVFTLSFQIIFGELIVGLRNITGGDEGFVIRQDIIPGTININRELTYYYVFVIILFAAILIYSRIINSHIGVAFKCITEDETAAAFVGINVVKYKVFSAFIGSFLFGLIGGIYAYYNLYIAPSMFNLQSMDTLILVMLVLGGMGTLLGPLLGAGVFALIFEFLRPLGQITTLVFGILLIILFVYFREGLVPWLKKLPALYKRL